VELDAAGPNTAGFPARNTAKSLIASPPSGEHHRHVHRDSSRQLAWATAPVPLVPAIGLLWLGRFIPALLVLPALAAVAATVAVLFAITVDHSTHGRTG